MPRHSFPITAEFRSTADTYRGLVRRLDAMPVEERTTAAAIALQSEADVVSRIMASHVVTRVFGCLWRTL